MLLVGDTRQHEAVEAGRPYQQLQEAGIETARLDEIVRQKDPALKEVVEQLSRGEVRDAMEKLDAQGRVHEIPDRDERLKEIAREYATKPEGTLVVSPDNRIAPSRSIRLSTGNADARPGGHTRTSNSECSWRGRRSLGRTGSGPRNTNRATWCATREAARRTASRPESMPASSSANEKENLVTVKRENGEQVSYDPRRLHGVTLYRETERAIQ